MTPTEAPAIALAVLLAAAAVAAATVAAGCGEKSESANDDSARLARRWPSTSTSTPTTPGSTRRSTAGYFRDAGLDVHPQAPSDPSAPIKEVAAGRADLAISYEPEVMLARDQGLPSRPSPRSSRSRSPR